VATWQTVESVSAKGSNYCVYLRLKLASSGRWCGASALFKRFSRTLERRTCVQEWFQQFGKRRQTTEASKVDD